jgi:hypothetical protein
VAGGRVQSGRAVRYTPAVDDDLDLAEALETRDELLIACREVLQGIGLPRAAALVGFIDELLDLDPEAPPRPRR